MALPFLVLFFFLLLLSSSSHRQTVHAETDTLRPGDSISLNRTILSSAGSFALGFFRLGASVPARYYLGIRYHNVADGAVVWVANRDSPLRDAYGNLTLEIDGNLVAYSSSGSKIWSSDTSAASRGTTEAVLLDSGNLVLRLAEGDEDRFIWQSFDHPTDTLLPEMRLTSYLRPGIASPTRCVSWRAEDDPSSGSFTLGIDPRSSMQGFIWRGVEPYWRSNLRSSPGSEINSTRIVTTKSTNAYVYSIAVEGDRVSWWFTATPSSTVSRVVIQESGFSQLLSWNASSGSWVIEGSVPNLPSRPCEFYNQCGPNGVCDGSQPTSRSCQCLRGFVPRTFSQWNAGNYSGGCMRATVGDCNSGADYVHYNNMKLPDRMILLRDASEKECRANCSVSCNCTAYSFSGTISIGSSTTCLVWFGDLVDLVQNLSRDELFVRVAASDLDSNSQNEGSSNKSMLLLAIMLTVGFILILLSGTAFYFWRTIHRRSRKHKENVTRLEELRSYDGGSIIDVPLLDFCSILKATDGFALTNKLGEGGFGSVYKGTLQDGKDIAVKRLSETSKQGFVEFRNEVELIARLQHTNLVRLLGWCNHQDEKILIYEYLPNHSLDKYLFDSNQSSKLDWDMRFQIIKGIAQGLLYLHRYSRLRVIHRDLKTDNILLDYDMNPKISDFGLARIFDGKQKEENTTRIVGTYGYIAPEYGLYGRFSEKSDIFSFGVIILEIISGRRNKGSYPLNGSLNLLGYAWQLWAEGRCCELVDPALEESFPVSEVAKCIQVGLLCVQDVPNDRPTIDAIIAVLVNENPPVLQPPGQPAFTSKDASPWSARSSPPELTMSVVEGR
ncbi:receptor-like serine/threonine-protein kinase SD1-8 [Zingiber officinale]|uniref:receptor-like serine/threonine-protein kinase SD1-8 n=1 Tax=Zingiber officinale TaxID=94328 RepID=UPI001C4A9549|nr:receptor-like serine/threonine-protein kinase SD1-8 [Zingiber officinale]